MIIIRFLLLLEKLYCSVILIFERILYNNYFDYGLILLSSMPFIYYIIFTYMYYIYILCIIYYPSNLCMYSFLAVTFAVAAGGFLVTYWPSLLQ